MLPQPLAVGWAVRPVAPAGSSLARRNIERAFPEKSAMEVDNILDDMWDNLGRVIGEFPHISKLDIYNDSRVQLEGIEQIDRIREGARPGIFLTPHMGNWELSAMLLSSADLFRPSGWYIAHRTILRRSGCCSSGAKRRP
jgi:KDO2-lipid IV(A) lauroyltransferase